MYVHTYIHTYMCEKNLATKWELLVTVSKHFIRISIVEVHMCLQFKKVIARNKWRKSKTNIFEEYFVDHMAANVKYLWQSDIRQCAILAIVSSLTDILSMIYLFLVFICCLLCLRFVYKFHLRGVSILIPCGVNFLLCGWSVEHSSALCVVNSAQCSALCVVSLVIVALGWLYQGRKLWRQIKFDKAMRESTTVY